MGLPAASFRPRLAVCCLAAGLWLLLFGPAVPSAQAQDPPVAEEKENKGSAAAPAAEAAPSTNIVKHIIRSVGWTFGFILLAVSIALVAIIVLLSMDLRMSTSIPTAFVEDFTDTVNKRKFKEAYEMAREDGSFLGRVLTTGMSRLQYGIEDAREAAFNMVESVKAGKEQLVTYLATIGTLGPMLGLVGTVYGMILSFMELGQPGKTPRPDKLADGISHALVVTLLGIGLSVPAIFFHAFFRNRLIRLSMDASNIADDLLTQMYHNSKKAAPAVAPSSAEVAAVSDNRAVAAGAVKPK